MQRYLGNVRLFHFSSKGPREEDLAKGWAAAKGKTGKCHIPPDIIHHRDLFTLRSPRSSASARPFAKNKTRARVNKSALLPFNERDVESRARLESLTDISRQTAA